jgi:hypothetical protein
MVDQASVGSSWQRGNGHEASAAAGVRNGVGDLLHDIVTLSELQSELLLLDARQSAQKAQTPIILMGIGAVLALGAVPVLLLALGEALVDFLEWKRSLAYLVSGLAGTIIGGVLLMIAWRATGDIIAVFNRSKAEFAENVRWIKYALTRGRRPPRENVPKSACPN